MEIPKQIWGFAIHGREGEESEEYKNEYYHLSKT